MSQEPYTPPAGPGQTPPPPPPPPTTQPPVAPPYGTPPQPPKSKKTLIIILIVLALLLCCCTTGGSIIALGYFADQDSATTLDEQGSVVATDSSNSELDNATETPLDEWRAWNPTVGDLGLDSPNAWQQAIVEEIVADLYPDFTLLDTYVDTGGWDEESQAYYMDYYNVRIALTNDPTVEIVEDFLAWCQEGMEDDALSTAEDAVEENQELGTLDDGTEYIFQLSNALLHYGMDTGTRELLVTVAEEWPGAAFTSVRYTDGNESEAKVSLTTWDHYYTTDYFEGVGAVYSLQNGQWLLDSYHWRLPEDE